MNNNIIDSPESAETHPTSESTRQYAESQHSLEAEDNRSTNNRHHNDTNNKRRPSNKVHSGFHDFFSTLGIIVTAIIVASLMITFVFRSYQVDGPSMQTTLQNNDKLIIWKVPRTWSDLTGNTYIPKRGNIIVFTQANLTACGQDSSKQLIKRVIGLPGDRVVVGNGIYTIYNKHHPSGFDPDKTLPYFQGRQIPTTSGNIDITLNSNELFVSGDNRPDSCDSRAFGPIMANQVIGKLVVRILPINSTEIF